jgi:hypothetical protein
VFRLPTIVLLAWLILPLFSGIALGAALHPAPAYPDLGDGMSQYAAFPRPLQAYPAAPGGWWEAIRVRAAAEPFNVAATVIFVLAILHTFSCGWFAKLAHHYEHVHQHELKARGSEAGDHPQAVPEVSFRSTLCHFLGEVEAVFGLWVIALAAVAAHFYSWTDFKLYVGQDCQFTEPMFVVVIMVIASSRPVLRFAERVLAVAAGLGKGTPAAWWLSVLTLAPILGSFITEPAAMTIGALLLGKRFFPCKPSPLLSYGTLGLLFVNISVGGTLTSFAAPPVLMVAGKWGWDTPFMLMQFGWKAVVGVLLASAAYWLLFRRELAALGGKPQAEGATADAGESWEERETPIPVWVTATHLGFLGWTVYATHYPVLFIGGFLFFLAFVLATLHHQNAINARGPLLVGFFLAGLVIHGGCQAWWIEPIILNLGDQTLMLGAAVLTAFNDNAAITYLASQVQGLGPTAKYAVVAGAVAGGGLTVIANAPNPAGQSLLGRFFHGGISPLRLLLGALIPTLIVYLCLSLLPGLPAKEAPPEERTDHTTAP